MFNKNKKKNGTLILAMSGLLAGTTMIGAPTANAGEGGGQGSGVCVSGCSLHGPFYWRFTSSTPGGKSAWDKFAANNNTSAAGLRRQMVEDHVLKDIHAVGMSNQELLNTCKTSKIVWWVSGSTPLISGYQNGWAWNFGGRSYPNADANTFKTAAAANGSSMDATTQARIVKFADGLGTNSLQLLCSNMGAPDKPADSTRTVTENKVSAPKVTEQEWTKPYSYSTAISRQITQNGIDPIGKNNLEDQPVTYTKTSFGALWDDMVKNKDKYSKMSSNDIAALVKLAQDADAKADHNKINLSQKNKEGMNEGGVLNVNEQTKNATIKTRKSVITRSSRTCTITTGWKFNDSTSTWVETSPVKTCGAWNNVDDPAEYTNSTIEDATLQQTGFWQMLSVHCNKADLEALIKATQGVRVQDTKDSTNKYSAVIYTKTYKTQPNVLDFGDVNNPNAAKKKSGQLGFYNKKCPFNCTASSVGLGASTSNGATSNVGSTTPKDGKRGSSYGMLSGSENNNTFDFFRDNVSHTITSDVWYPKSEGVVDYQGDAPISTMIARWADGTPAINDATGGKFTITTMDGTKLFDGSDQTKENKSWSLDEYKNSTLQVMKGLQRSFNVKASWASDPNKPQALTLDWAYSPRVTTQFYTNDIGFGSTSNSIGTATVNAGNVEGDCIVQYGTTDYPDTTKKLHDYTGSGTDNKLLNPTNDKKDKGNFFVNFIRSASE